MRAIQAAHCPTTCEAIQSSKESKLASLNMGDNRIGPEQSPLWRPWWPSQAGPIWYLRLFDNIIGAAGEKAVRDAVKDHSGFELEL